MTDKTRFQNRIALITGAGSESGIGFAAARTLASGSARLALTSTTDRIVERSKTISAGGSRVKGYTADLMDRDQVKKLVDSVIHDFGRIDILVNNAGVIKKGPVEMVPEEDWDLQIGVNLKGTFLMCHHAIPALKKTRGVILNIASDAGILGFGGHAAYCASKGGVVLMSRAMALDLAPHRVRVIPVCPGNIMSPMLEYEARTSGKDPDVFFKEALTDFPQGDAARFIHPKEVANLLAFLASDRAEAMTGAPVHMDFGTTAGG